MKKKVLSVILAMVMILTLFPMGALAADSGQDELTPTTNTSSFESTDLAVEEDIPSPDSYTMYRAPEIILSEDYAFTENEIAEVRNGNSTDERVGYAHNQAEFKALIATPSIKIIVIAARTIEVNENLIVDRSITFLSFSAEPVTLRGSSELERNSYFIQVSEQDGSPIIDRDINLRFSNVIIECKHAGGCMNIKAADDVADHQADYSVRIEGACVHFCKEMEYDSGVTSYSVRGLGNIDLIGCIFSSLDRISGGPIGIDLKQSGITTIKDCTFFNLSVYGVSINEFCPHVGPPFDIKPLKASIINCKTYRTPFLYTSNIKEVEVKDTILWKLALII